MRRFVRGICLAALLLSASCAGAAEKLNAVVTHPWLAIIASFLGGPNVVVSPLLVWNDAGELVRAEGGRRLRGLEADANIMALDSADAEAAGLKGDTQKNLRMLYAPFPIAASSRDAAMADPSVTPFVAQRVLTILAGWDPSNYSYYQRRLAEFQARLSSSVLAGRQVLQGVAVCDLSGASGALLRAAGCRVERPDIRQLEGWSRSSQQQLRHFLDEKAAAKVVVVMDGGTPKALKGFLKGRDEVFSFARPPLDKSYPVFLNDQYISLWQKISATPLPKVQPGKKR